MNTLNVILTETQKKFIATGLTPSDHRSNSDRSASLELAQYATAPLPRPDGGAFNQLAKDECKRKRGVNPSAGVLIETDALKAWFAGSTVSDTDGRPLVAFHGTSFPGKRFLSRGKSAYAQFGHWFDADPVSVHSFALAKEQAHCSNLLLVHLSIRNPKKYPNMQHMRDDANGKFGDGFALRVRKLRKDL